MNLRIRKRKRKNNLLLNPLKNSMTIKKFLHKILSTIHKISLHLRISPKMSLRIFPKTSLRIFLKMSLFHKILQFRILLMILNKFLKKFQKKNPNLNNLILSFYPILLKLTQPTQVMQQILQLMTLVYLKP